MSEIVAIKDNYEEKIITSTGDFIETINNNNKNIIQYQYSVLVFFIRNEQACANILCVSELGRNIYKTLSFLQDTNYYYYISNSLPIEQNNPNLVYHESIKTCYEELFSDDYKILMFSIYYDIGKLFEDMMNKIIFKGKSLFNLRIIINFCLRLVKFNRYLYIIDRTCIEFKFVRLFHFAEQGLYCFDDFNGRIFNQFITTMYGSNEKKKTTNCNCYGNMMQATSFSNNLIVTEIQKPNCRFLMMLIVYNFFDIFKIELENFDKENILAIQILLRLSIISNKFLFFQHIVENSKPKIPIVNDLPTYVLNFTCNFDFLKFIFKGKCRTTNIVMCKYCSIGEDKFQHVVCYPDEHKRCRDYITKKIVKKNNVQSENLGTEIDSK